MAIAVNNGQADSATAANSITLSYTVSAGDDEILETATAMFDANVISVSGVTFNGDALTSVATPAGSSQFSQDWLSHKHYRLAPDVATANIVASLSGTANGVALCAHYLTGAEQQAPEATGTADDTSEPFQVSATPVTTPTLITASCACWTETATELEPDGSETEIAEAGANHGDGFIDLAHEYIAGSGTGAHTLGFNAGTDPGHASLMVAVWAEAAEEAHTSTGALTLQAISVSAVGEQPHEGAGALTLADVSLDAVGVMHPDGQGALTVQAASVSAAGEMPAEGQGAAVLGALSLDAVGVLHPEAAGTLVLNVIETDASGAMPSEGLAIAVLQALAVAATGELPPIGDATLTLQPIVITSEALFEIVITPGVSYVINLKERPGGPWRLTTIIFQRLVGDVWDVWIKRRPGGPWDYTQLIFE